MKHDVSEQAAFLHAKKEVDWIWSHLKILQYLESIFSEQKKPFAGIRIGICLHIEPKTAGLIRVLLAGGAEIAITGSPGTTQNHIARYLAKIFSVQVYGSQQDQRSEHINNIQQVVAFNPHLILDNGADLFTALLKTSKLEILPGGTEAIRFKYTFYYAQLSG